MTKIQFNLLLTIPKNISHIIRNILKLDQSETLESNRSQNHIGNKTSALLLPVNFGKEASVNFENLLFSEVPEYVYTYFFFAKSFIR